jgi:hypothetical protein
MKTAGCQEGLLRMARLRLEDARDARHDGFARSANRTRLDAHGWRWLLDAALVLLLIRSSRLRICTTRPAPRAAGR